jgi:2-aminoethylphosphonate-pyruvate transaminase
MQAVILAAGLGSRIRDMHSMPKGFIQLGDQPIIQESIQTLKQFGVTDILIITGYAADYYEALAKTDAALATVFNPNYDRFGSLYSLYCAKDWVKNDFLVLESDIIYEKSAIDTLIHDNHSNAILLSGETHFGDEVYVQAQEKKLIRMSKDKNQLALDQIYGEFVGINKLSLCDFRQLMHQLEQQSPLLQSGHYDENGIVAMAAFTEVHCLKIPDLLWCEIDNRLQFEGAKKLYERMYVTQGTI